MGEIKIKEGARINWSDEVEKDVPAGWHQYSEEIWQKKPKAAVKKREVHIRKETTHPYEVRVGAYLALKEGEEGMRRLHWRRTLKVLL